jgi:hypothetical protein
VAGSALVEAGSPRSFEVRHGLSEDPAIDERRLRGERREHRPCVRTEGLQRGNEAFARLAACAGQPLQPGCDVHGVVALLAADLADKVGQWRPRAAVEGLESDGVRRLIEVTPGDRHRPVAPAVIEQAGVTVIGGVAVVGDGVSVRVLDLCQ